MAKVLRLFVIFFLVFLPTKKSKMGSMGFRSNTLLLGIGIPKFFSHVLPVFKQRFVCLLVVSYNDYSTWYLIKKIKMSVEKSFKMPLNEIFLTIFVRMCLGHSGRFTFRPLVRSFENSHPFFSLMQNSSSNKANKQKNIPFLHDY